MAVHKRGYQRYQGPLTGHVSRLMAIPRYAWGRLIQQRFVSIFFVISFFWPLLCAFWVYFSNRPDLWEGIAPGMTTFLKVDGKFFLIFMDTQAVFAILLAAIAGPGLIAPDLANKALPFYFSRPLSRFDYVFARLMVLLGVLSMVTWVPGLFLYLMQTGLAGWSWFSENWALGLGVLGGFFLWILLVSLIALSCSAYVKWRIVSSALVLGFFFILGGAAEIMNAVFRTDWGALFNPARCMERVWREMLNVEQSPGPGATECAASLVLMVLILCWVLDRKLRPVEVVK